MLKILVCAKVIVAFPMTLNVNIEELSPITNHTVTILFTDGLRAAVSGGIPLISNDGTATVTSFAPGDTFRAAFEIGGVIVKASVVTIILIDHRAVTRLGGGCHPSD